jgi:hypothetical protein
MNDCQGRILRYAQRDVCLHRCDSRAVMTRAHRVPRQIGAVGPGCGGVACPAGKSLVALTRRWSY